MSQETIRWSPACQVEVLDQESIFLSTEKEKTIFHGKIFSQIAPLLSKQNLTHDQIVEKFSGIIAPERVYYTLFELEKKGWVQKNHNLLPQNLVAFSSLLGISESEAYVRLQEAKIYLQTPSGGLREVLERLPLQITKQEEEATFSIRCVEDYLDPALETLDTSKPWLLCKPSGSEVWIGPYFQPGKGGCYHCLATRLKINQIEEQYIQQKYKLNALPFPSSATIPSTQHLAWNWIATEVFKLVITGETPQIEGKVQTFDTLSSKTREHLLIKRPTCPKCGETSSGHPSPISLKSRPIKGRDGGYRSLTPEETIKKYEHLVSPITGVVKYLEPVEESDDSPIHVYRSGSNLALPNLQLGKSLSTFRRGCAGKGISDSQAKASALCESLERISGVYYGDETRKLATYRELEGDAIHPDQVMLFSEQQYKNRKAWNQNCHSFWKVPSPFPEEEKLSWTPLYSLTEKRIKFYPTSLCYYATHEEKWEGSVNSNGCAAGNCLEEAILQGFYELVERDSIAIWWYNRLSRPSVDLTSFQNPYIEMIQTEYAKQNREVWVVDITTDLGIPSFVALSRVIGEKHEQILQGFGSHLNAEVALLRALSELNQGFACGSFWDVKDFGEGKQEHIDKQIVKEWMEEVRIDNTTYLRSDLPTKQATDYNEWESNDLLHDIAHCRSIIESRGMEFLVLDQTRADIGLHVARVIVPGLRHFWPRFAPGRLYDVPVEMGILQESLSEKELNKKGVFL